MITWLTAILGTGLSLGVGSLWFGFDAWVVIWCVAVSNAAGLLVLLLVSQSARTRWIKRWIMPNPAMTWLSSAAIWLAIQVGLCSILREPGALAALILPLFMSDGFAILAYGPIQDRIVARTRS